MKKSTLNFLIFSLLPSFIFAQNLYDIENITSIELTIQESNWDEILDQYYAADNGERLLATAIINGITFDSVGIRYKGNATYNASNAKNPINLKLNYIKNQDYGGFETLKLSSGSHDPSFVREVLSYKIARKYMVAPLSNYAKIYINGNYHGLYSSSESINGDFGERYLFADGNNTRFKCNSDENGFGSNASLEFLGTDSTNYYGQYILKSDYGWADLAELIDVLSNSTEDIEGLLDMDKAIWMLAFNNVLVNLDSYSGRKANYYLIKDDNEIFNAVLWDMNESLGGFEQVGTGMPSLNALINLSPSLHQGDNSYPLIKLVLENDSYRKMYIAHCRTILEENFVNGWYETKGEALQNLIIDAVQSDPNALYTVNQFNTNLSTTVSGSGGGPGGVQGAYGITELFDARLSFLQNQTLYQYAPPSIVNVSSSPEIVEEFSAFTLKTEVLDANAVWLYYRNLASDEFIKSEMFDDGTHDDGTANDGIFGIQLEANSTDIEYYVYAENENAGLFSPLRAAHEFYNLEVINTAGDIVINEFMADNESTVSDSADEFDDWIELYNNTDSAISLEGYTLSDDENDLAQWVFPNVSIEANGYLIIWADKDEEQEGLHANFKLSANGEAIYFSTPEGETLDQIIFGAQTADITTARIPNGIGDFTTSQATFNTENEEALGIIATFKNDILVKIYPNPANDFINIELEKEESFNENEIRIFNTFGQEVFNKTMNNTVQQIDVSTLNSGLYLISIYQKGKLIFSTKLLIH